MGQAAMSLVGASGKVAPIQFAPRAKDESNKLRRKNSLYEEIVQYLDSLDNAPDGITELVEAAALSAASAKEKPEPAEDPRLAALNKTADQIRAGDLRTLRGVITNHFKTINRRYQGKHALNTLLHISSREGYWRMVTTIFDDRTRIPADRDVPILVDARNQRGRTPLHVAFQPPNASYNGVTHGLEPSALKANAPRPEGVTMDTDWVRPGDIKFRRKIVKTLIAEGADYEARDIMDFVPLHYASLWGWDDCVTDLIGMGADLAPITSTGTTPLMMACSRGHLKVVALLLADQGGASAEIEARDAQGDSALLFATRRGNFDVVRMLVEDYKADVNVENYMKGKPLIEACAHNSLDMVNLLLDHHVEKDRAAFELLRGQTAVMIRARLKLEEGDEGSDSDEEGRHKKDLKGAGIGAWVIYKEVKPGKKTKRGQREPVFYYNSVTRQSVRYRPSDYEHDPLHIPKKAMFGMHFYH